MSLRVHLRPEAETDIEEAAAWYEKQCEGLGDELLEEVLSDCETISEKMPNDLTHLFFCQDGRQSFRLFSAPGVNGAFQALLKHLYSRSFLRTRRGLGLDV